ncbi:MAG: hypothetical protein ABSH32_21975 [Bryobacteraceae bacterium]|jgi:hypothetical protein
MMQLLRFGLSCLIPVLALAQSPFDGTWRVVPGSDQFPTKPDVYLLQNRTYRCPTCDPPLAIAADGEGHRIAASCYDTVSVKVVDDRTTEETDKKNGKTVGTSKMTVSSDGKTATVESTEMCNAKGDVIAVKKSMERVAQGPEGAHAVSGSWRTTKYLNMSENALVATMKLEGDTFSFADPAGMSYTAKLDGTETPIKGDLGNTVVSVKRIDRNTVQETEKRDGKIVNIIRIAVSSDGKTMTWSGGDKAKGTAWQFVAQKQ